MDLWVVAAVVAGAGYAAKYWQQIISKGNEDSSEPVSGDLVYWRSDSRKLFHQFRDCALPLPRWRQRQSGVWDEHSPEVYNDSNVLSLMNLATCVNGMDDSQGIGYGEKGLIQITKPMNTRNRSEVSSAKLQLSCGFSISSTEASDQGTTYQSQGSGSSNELLFFLGIAIGIMSTIHANTREQEKLKQPEEVLVQDLQKELEKKLACKDLQEPDKSTIFRAKEIGKNGAEKVELMNNIGAELEAELEKLELSMNTARLERISKLAELQIDPANYAVPPMELSLRLHEVIKSRLEARVMELEAVLERHSVESDHIVSSRMLYSESESSSTQGSSICSNEDSDSDDEISLELIHGNGHFQKVQNPEVEERWSTRDVMLDKLTIEEEISTSWRSDAFGEGEEEDDDQEDEIDRLLRQIVERTKQGSPATLNVQKRLCSVDL